MTAGPAEARRRAAVLLGTLLLALLVLPSLGSLPSWSSPLPTAAASCEVVPDHHGDGLRAELPAAGLHTPDRVDQHRVGVAKASPARAQRRAPAVPSGDVLAPRRPDGRQACDVDALTRRGPPAAGV